MASEYFKVTSWQPEKMMVARKEWEQNRPVEIEARDLGLQIFSANEQYRGAFETIERIVTKGDLGDCTVLNLAHQLIPDFGVSRKLLVTLPAFPEDTFVIGGIGAVTLDDGERIRIQTPDPSETIHTKIHLPESAMATGYVRADGKSERIQNQEPYGGYWLSTAMIKYRKTAEAQKFVPSPENCCTPVMCGELKGIDSDKPLGIFVYRLPRSAANISLGYDHDSYYWHEQVLLPIADGQDISTVVKILTYGQAAHTTHEAMGLLDYLHTRKEAVHRQYHIGNIYQAVTERSDRSSPYLIVSDWDTSDRIANYSKQIAHKYKKPISPYDEVRWHDIDNALNLLSGVGGNQSHIPLWKMSLGIVGIMGYQHIPYGDMNAVEALYDHLAFRYKDTYGSSFSGDVGRLPNDEALKRVYEVTKDTMTERFIDAGYFESLVPKR